MPDPTSPRTPETETADEAPTNAAAATDEQRADGTVEPEVTEPAAPADRTAELEAAVADLRDRFLRSHAEMENLRRRTEREVQDARKYALTAFARDLLSVADNLRRTLESSGSAGEAAKPLVEGVELTERELLKTLDKHGVAKLDPKGQPFDPNFHQAMFEAPDPSVPNGTVVQVVQDGYVIGDRLLRPAMVGVARGGPKPGSAEAAPAEPKAGVDRTA
ncbi:nucleotide exchange factor GrpE [Methylopila turkensis]|uniref:Protein GrpE n=1 Tax=Methylopila turkensis TaxID=1437816 RepID=A0A9W6JMM2_9HYPH|nr:nucleotide exchange factor GrpE [Methylopila turkensis]GLK79882.1 protein GrpE [Methylopila turkensis]